MHGFPIAIAWLATASTAFADVAEDVTVGVGVSHASQEANSDGRQGVSSSVAPTFTLGFSLGATVNSGAVALRGRALMTVFHGFQYAYAVFLGPVARFPLAERVLLHAGVGGAVHAVKLGEGGSASSGVGLDLRIERVFDCFSLGLETAPFVFGEFQGVRLWEVAVTISTGDAPFRRRR